MIVRVVAGLIRSLAQILKHGEWNGRSSQWCDPRARTGTARIHGVFPGRNRLSLRDERREISGDGGRYRKIELYAELLFKPEENRGPNQHRSETNNAIAAHARGCLAFAFGGATHVCPRVGACRCRVTILACAFHGSLILLVKLLGLFFLFPVQNRQRLVVFLLRKGRRAEDRQRDGAKKELFHRSTSLAFPARTLTRRQKPLNRGKSLRNWRFILV